MFHTFATYYATFPTLQKRRGSCVLHGGAAARRMHAPRKKNFRAARAVEGFAPAGATYFLLVQKVRKDTFKEETLSIGFPP